MSTAAQTKPAPKRVEPVLRRGPRSAATSPSCPETVHGKPLVYLDNAATRRSRGR